MFTNTTKYAIKAMLYLTLHSTENKKLKIKDLAQPINVPNAYIAKILQALSKHNLVSSSKGPKGGFFVNNEQKNTNILEIIEAVEGSEKMNSCLLSLENCNALNPCSLHHLVYPEKQKISEKLKITSLAELKQHILDGKSILPI